MISVVEIIIAVMVLFLVFVIILGPFVAIVVAGLLLLRKKKGLRKANVNERLAASNNRAMFLPHTNEFIDSIILRDRIHNGVQYTEISQVDTSSGFERHVETVPKHHVHRNVFAPGKSTRGIKELFIVEHPDPNIATGSGIFEELVRQKREIEDKYFKLLESCKAKDNRLELAEYVSGDDMALNVVSRAKNLLDTGKTRPGIQEQVTIKENGEGNE